MVCVCSVWKGTTGKTDWHIGIADFLYADAIFREKGLGFSYPYHYNTVYGIDTGIRPPNMLSLHNINVDIYV